jgi:hypothetical protein
VADEVKVAFGLDGPPEANRTAWKSGPPPFLGDYHLEDESYGTLVFEAQVMGVGMRILMFGMAKTLYRLSATFADDPVGTRVSLAGQAKEDVRDEIGAYLREHTRPL